MVGVTYALEWWGNLYLYYGNNGDKIKTRRKHFIINNYYVYILSNFTNTTLYIGVTNNLRRRVFEHKNKLINGFTEKYNIYKLVYYETTSNITSAIQREKNLKKWKRIWKIELIKKTNPYFRDLSLDWE
ncbi:MAG: GIY-YIG nuclease family protein [Treponema sp.]|nr:GIY-YIG nuclease family protein [Treponema sp.]